MFKLLKMMPVVACVLLEAVGVQAAPNFVIFVADDMAWDDCSAYGHPTIRTPQMQRIANEGMRFDRAYLTCSSCSPSRCSMLTGRYPHSTGAGELHLPLPADQTLLTTPLRKLGYYTAAVGKWHLGNAAISQMDLVKQGGGPGGEAHWVDVVRERPKEKPFFLWLAATDPHRGYKPGAIDPPHTLDDVQVPAIFPDTSKVKADLALYYDEIGRFDEYIGRVLNELEAQGVLDETFVLVISDNGRPFPRCKTTVIEDGVKTPFLLRYPPLVQGGTITTSLVSTVDLAPTVIELAGGQPLASFQGQSFVPIMRDPAHTTRQATFSEHNWHDYRAFERAACTQRFRYVRNWLPELPLTPPADAVRSPTYDEMKRLYQAGQLDPPQQLVFQAPRPEEELYDVLHDPLCLTNLLSATPTSEEIQQALKQHRQLLQKWQAETEDAFPGKDQLTPDGFDRVDGTRLPGVAAPHPSFKK